MSVLLLLWGGFAALYGFIALAGSKSAIHEIEAGLAFLIATVAIGSAAIIDQLKKNAAKPEPNDGGNDSETEPSGRLWGEKSK